MKVLYIILSLDKNHGQARRFLTHWATFWELHYHESDYWHTAPQYLWVMTVRYDHHNSLFSMPEQGLMMIFECCFNDIDDDDDDDDIGEQWVASRRLGCSCSTSSWYMARTGCLQTWPVSKNWQITSFRSCSNSDYQVNIPTAHLACSSLSSLFNILRLVSLALVCMIPL